MLRVGERASKIIQNLVDNAYKASKLQQGVQLHVKILHVMLFVTILTTSSAQADTLPERSESFDTARCPIGDINGDGAIDYWVTDPGALGGSGCIFIVSGSRLFQGGPLLPADILGSVQIPNGGFINLGHRLKSMTFAGHTLIAAGAYKLAGDFPVAAIVLFNPSKPNIVDVWTDSLRTPPGQPVVIDMDDVWASVPTGQWNAGADVLDGISAAQVFFSNFVNNNPPDVGGADSGLSGGLTGSSGNIYVNYSNKGTEISQMAVSVFRGQGTNPNNFTIEHIVNEIVQASLLPTPQHLPIIWD